MTRTRHRSLALTRRAVIGVLLGTAPVRAAMAQGLGDRVHKVAQHFAAFATETAMSGAAVIDLEARGLERVLIGALSVGVSQVDVKSAVGVRVHAYYFNPTDSAVTLPLPVEATFVLVDGVGRRLTFMSIRLPNAVKGSTTFVVPSLERAQVTLLYGLTSGATPDGVLKIGTSGVIHGVPLSGLPGAPSPSPPPPLQPAPVVPQHR